MNYEKITTFEEACKVANVSPDKLPVVEGLPKKYQNWLINSYKIAIITQAINTDEKCKVWEPDYNNKNQRKYFPWFEVEATKEHTGGVGFSGSHYDDWYSYTFCGSRLCFDTPQKVYHAQKYFNDYYMEFHLIME